MLYTIARTQHAIIIIGSIPQFELNALLNVWQQETRGAMRQDTEIARKLGYAVVLGTAENLETWRHELGLNEKGKIDVPEEVPEAAG